MKQQTLFKTPQLRLANGRFCTEKDFIVDKAMSENKRLRYEKEKYLRAWLAATKRIKALELEILKLKGNDG